MADVFISYARDDAPFAKRLGSALEREGIGVWLDEESIRPGDLWISEVSKAIQTAKVFMPVISSSYSNSSFASTEIAVAIGAQSGDPSKMIIPVVIDRNARLPTFIDQYQYLDLSADRDFYDGVSKIRNIIRDEGARSDRTSINIGGITAGRDIQIAALDRELRVASGSREISQ